MSTGPFIEDDLAEWQGFEVVDGHLAHYGRRPTRKMGPCSVPSLALATKALRAVACDAEAKLLETSGVPYWTRGLTGILVCGLTRIARQERGPWLAALAACKAVRREVLEANKPPPWDIRRKGRSWPEQEFLVRWESLGDCKAEVVGGKLFNDQHERMAVLAMVLEGVGIDAAVRLGDLALWKAAVDAALRAKRARTGRKRPRSKR